ncbi:MAG: FAD/NAD(P)-binding protein [Bryobacterales bacterium]|nr:FAD/NAD(P)-binding protein [Bryobacterales bacterium]
MQPTIDVSTDAADPMTPRLFRVVKNFNDTGDCYTLSLKPEDGDPLLFAPGQFTMLYAFGRGEVPISISGDPAEPGTLIHTIREVGPVTQALREVKKGGLIGVRGPYGTAWPVKEAEGNDVVFVAGGIGLAPLRPALYHVLHRRSRYGKVALLYGARTPNDILYRDELERWRSRFDMQVEVTVDRSQAAWRGHVGVVTRLISRTAFDPVSTVAMVCGPEVMMRFAVSELTARGVAQEQIHVSLERNMKCAVGFCGHCQLGPAFICKDGPVFVFPEVKRLLSIREV